MTTGSDFKPAASVRAYDDLPAESRLYFGPTYRRGVLSDVSIIKAVMCGLIVIDPFDLSHVQPASYDLTLAEDVTLDPGECLLASTVERLQLGPDFRGTLSGRSSVARHFVFAHCQGGYIDPGFFGSITLELFNASKITREYVKGDRLIQVSLDWLDQPAAAAYKGRYQGQTGPTESRFEHGDL